MREAGTGRPTTHPAYPRHLPGRNPLRPRPEVAGSWRDTVRAASVAAGVLVRMARQVRPQL